MAFSYVTWKNRTPLSSDNFSQMSDNDQHVNDILEPAAKGIIRWTATPEDFVIDENLNAWTQVFHFNFNDVYIEANRFTLVGVNIATVSVPAAFVSPSLAVRIMVDDVQASIRYGQIQGSKLKCIQGPRCLLNLSEGLHDFRVEAGVNFRPAGQEDSGGKIEADVTTPTQFWIEDKGAFVAAS